MKGIIADSCGVWYSGETKLAASYAIIYDKTLCCDLFSLNSSKTSHNIFIFSLAVLPLHEIIPILPSGNILNH
jgi:hypothetical protein